MATSKKGRKVKERDALSLENLQETWKRKKKIIIYGFSFFVLVIFFAWLGDQPFFEEFSKPILSVYSAVSSFFLNILGQGTRASGDIISSPGFSISIKKGCDALAPMALYSVAILSFPVAFKYKWKGIIVGLVALFFLNVIRIVTLYLIGAYARPLFDFAHVQLWQVIAAMPDVRVLTIWILETSVHLPCRTISTQLLILGILLVNGAATLASPSLTTGISPVSISSN